ncbi:MAG: flagellar protein FlaG [Pseudomonadales bacterium]|nr:flagellar protein FlaG [Pseudomonadales bacterium]
MNINDSSTVVSNSVANTKTASRSTNPKPRESEATQVPPTAESKAPNPLEKSQEVEAQQAQLEVKELKQDQTEAETEQEIQEKVESAVETLKGFIQENQRALDFDVAKESNRVIITVIDRQTNEVIRQIPPEDAIEMAERIESGDDITSSGVLLEGKA